MAIYVFRRTEMVTMKKSFLGELDDCIESVLIRSRTPRFMREKSRHNENSTHLFTFHLDIGV